MPALAWFALVWLQQAALAPPPLTATPVVEAGAPLRDMTLDATGKSVFTLSEAGVLVSWSTRDWKSAWSLEKRGAWAVDVAGEGLLVTMATPRALRVDAAGASGANLPGPPQLLTHACAVDPKGEWVWVGVPEGLVRLAPALEKGWSRVELENGGVTALALDEKGERLAIGNRDGSVRFADAKTGELDYARVAQGPASEVTALAFGPKALVAASADGSMRVWNPSSALVKAELRQSGAPVRVLAVAGRAGWFASGDGDGNVLVWTLGGSVRAQWKNPLPGAPIVALAFAPDEKALFAAAGARVLALDLASVK